MATKSKKPEIDVSMYEEFITSFAGSCYLTGAKYEKGETVFAKNEDDIIAGRAVTVKTFNAQKRLHENALKKEAELEAKMEELAKKEEELAKREAEVGKEEAKDLT